MFIIDRLFSRLTLRCLCSVLIGMMVVAGFSKLLSVYGGRPELASTAYAPAPAGETALQKLAAELARESRRLAEIAPAAGR